jgi:hypothetical protein
LIEQVQKIRSIGLADGAERHGFPSVLRGVTAQPFDTHIGGNAKIVRNDLGYPPHLFSDVRILKDFKCCVFGSADSAGVTGAFCGSADCKGVREFEVEFCEDWVGQTGAQQCCTRTAAERTGVTFPTRFGLLGRRDG